MDRLIVSPSPHQKSNMSTQGIMISVLVSLLPAVVASGIIFGLKAILVILTCVSSSLIFEYGCRLIMKKKQTISDLSAAVTGVILSLNLPATIPLWQAIIGSFIAIVIVKQLFGGLGQNFANPAITARIVLMLSFTSSMTTWVEPFFYKKNDIVSSATPLVKEWVNGQSPFSYKELFLGTTGGCIGETCALALLIGGLYLIIRRIISPATPVAFIGSVALLAWISGGDVLYQLLSGGLILGAFFMATDYVTSPVTNKGRFIFGIGCGVITFLIRQFGSYPEGVSFSILLMNILTPYIDRFTRTKPIGTKKQIAQNDKKMKLPKAPLVIMLICGSICGLLIAAYEATYTDTTGLITDSLQKGLNEIYGESDTEYRMLKNEDGTVKTYDGVTSIIVNDNKQVAFEIISDGYTKGGLHTLIGIDENGKLKNISIISISETQGLGTKVKNRSFLDQFVGIDSDDYNVEGITGATYSVKGIKNAVNLAINIYNEHKEEILGE